MDDEGDLYKTLLTVASGCSMLQLPGQSPGPLGMFLWKLDEIGPPDGVGFFFFLDVS